VRTLYPVIVTIAFAVSFAILGQAGFFAAWGGDVGVERGESVTDELNEGAEDVPVGGGEDIRGDASASGDNSDIITMVVNGGKTLGSIAGMVATLPGVLYDLAYPFLGPVAVIVYPLGSAGTLLVGIGVIEWLTNREWT
jgi:hypothetical protein